MKKSLKLYREYIQKVINSNDILDKEKALEYHKSQIAFFQHERLVHLIVTLFFAIMMIMAMLFSKILSLAFLVLLIPYIAHYYFLENQVQALYKDYDKLYEKFYGISYISQDYRGKDE